MDQLALFNLKIDKCRWTKDNIVEQQKLIAEFLAQRQNLSVTDVGNLERVFQRKLSLSRDEWFRLCVSTDTERLKLLAIAWEKKLNAKSPPVAASTVGHDIYPHAGFLGEFVYDFGRSFESPDSFFFWSGVTAISAVVRRHCFVKFGNSPLYPNFYVILVGSSGKVKKATPIKATENLVRYIPDINFIERTTTERLPHDLSYNTILINGVQQRTPIDAQGFLCAEELVAVLDDASYNAGVMKFLIEWWDCPDQKGVRSLKHGVIQLKNLHITLLGGTTPEWLQGALSSLVAGGGMLNRTIFVCEDDSPKYIEWPLPPDPAITQRLQQQLAHIEQQVGEFTIHNDVWDWNHKWYKQFKDYLKRNEQDAPSLQRKQAHMLKLAMILALSEGRPMEINPALLEQANKILDKQEEGLPQVARSLVAVGLGRDHLRVLEQLRKAGGELAWSDLLRKNSPHGVDTEMMAKIVKHLEEAEQVIDKRDFTKPRNPRYISLRTYTPPPAP